MEYSNPQIRQLIDDWIHSERDREILKRRLVDGICFEVIGEEVGLSSVQVRRIVRKERTRLFRMIDK